MVKTYGAACSLLVAVLAVDLEGDIVGGVALDLERAGGQVVEVLVQQLEIRKKSMSAKPPQKKILVCRKPGELEKTLLSNARPNPIQKSSVWAVYRRQLGASPSLSPREGGWWSESRTHVVGRLGNIREVGDRHRDCSFEGDVVGLRRK